MTFTTVGYGDITPTTKSSQVWTAFFILIGVTIAANLIGVITAMVAKMKQQEQLERDLEAKNSSDAPVSKSICTQLDDRVRSLFDKATGFMDDNVHKIGHFVAQSKETLSKKASFSSFNPMSPTPVNAPARQFKAMKEIELRMKHLAKVVQDLRYVAFINFLVIWAIILFGMLAMVTIENWTSEEAFYWCVITICTVGYGDVVPTTRTGKIFTIFFIAIGTSYMGKTLSDLVMVSYVLSVGLKNYIKI